MHVIIRAALTGALPFLLAACASDSQIGLQPLVCPMVGVLSDASSLRVYGEGAGRGDDDRAYDLEFMRAHLLECELKDGEMKAAIRFEARARTGPAAVSDEYAYPYFVALLAPDGEVLSKTVLNATAKFKSDGSEIFFAEEYDDIKFTVPEGADGLGYEILIGFQLTREQMDFNRAQRAAPKADSVPDVVTQ